MSLHAQLNSTHFSFIVKNRAKADNGLQWFEISRSDISSKYCDDYHKTPISLASLVICLKQRIKTKPKENITISVFN